MKKGFISSSIFLMFLAFACNTDNSPKNVAKKFLQATSDEKYEEAKKYCTNDTKKLLDMMASISKMATDSGKDKKHEFVMLDEKINGDAAVVTYKDEKSDKPETINLKKEKGQWLMSVSKDDLQNKDKKDAKSSQDQPADDNSKNEAAPDSDSSGNSAN